MDPRLQQELRRLRENNDWQGIYRHFAPLDRLPEMHPEIWQDAALLSDIGFAVAKLAETTANDIPKEEPRRTAFVVNQAKYRQETEALYRRCVELEPDEPRHWSALGYFYYQNVQELSEPRGRRDGDLRHEIDMALAALDRAIALDPGRIKDHYRRGRLLVRFLPDQILFGRQRDDETDRQRLARTKRLEGINALCEAIRCWETLSADDPRQERERQRCRKEYVRALYNVAHGHYDLIGNDWDEAVFGLRLREGIPASAHLSYSPADLDHACQAERYMYRCWLADRVHIVHSDHPLQAGIQSAVDGIEDGPDKLYWFGKIAFAKYWILSSYGQLDTPEATRERDAAQQYLEMALECPWPPEHARKSKVFIAERLGRLYITKGDHGRAIDIIQAHRPGRHLEPYVAHTLGLALLLARRTDEARQVLTEAERARGNRDRWTSWLLLGCVAMTDGRWAEAAENFRKAHIEARRYGKQTVDSILIGQAFASYKLDRQSEALEFLRQAVELNPHRLTAKKRLELWQRRQPPASRPRAAN